MLKDVAISKGEIFFIQSDSSSRDADRFSKYDLDDSRVDLTTPALRNHQVVALLPSDNCSLPFHMKAQGPGNPRVHSGLSLHPTELVVDGICLQTGSGLTALQNFWKEYSEMPKLPEGPPEEYPSGCLTVKLHNVTVSEETLPGSDFVEGGGWPKKYSIPMLELRNTRKFSELPATLWEA